MKLSSGDKGNKGESKKEGEEKGEDNNIRIFKFSNVNKIFIFFKLF